jgi:hypothetical protein
VAVWDELRVFLTWLRDEQSGTLLEFPDPRYKEGQPPPFQITLAPSAVAVAEDLHRRFGDSVLLTVGCLPYPPGRPPDRPLDILTRPPPGELLDPQEAEARLDGPATVRSGQTLHHGLLVRNLTGRELTIATNGQVTAVVVDPRTGNVIGGFAEAQHPIGIDFRVAPGTTRADPAPHWDRQLHARSGLHRARWIMGHPSPARPAAGYAHSRTAADPHSPPHDYRLRSQPSPSAGRPRTSEAPVRSRLVVMMAGCRRSCPGPTGDLARRMCAGRDEPMALWQMDIMGGVFLADGREIKLVSG